MERLTPLPWQSALWQQVTAARERLPHALLLHGMRGIGKRQFMRALAQLLLCECGGKGGFACGECPGCQLFAAGNHPDLRWLIPEADLPVRADSESGDGTAPGAEAKSSRRRAILIDQVRELGEFLTLASHRGGRRVVLLAPAEALNGPAANALLKVLEEPPAGVVFLAISDELDAVLPTVLSRCVLLRAPMPDTESALNWLQSSGVDDAEMRLAESGGAPLAAARAEEGSEGRDLTAELKERLLQALGKGGRLQLADVVSVVPRDVPVAAAIRLFQRWGWDLLAERTAGRLRYYPQRKRTIAIVARGCDPESVLAWLSQLNEGQAVAEHPLNPRLVIESALIGYMKAVEPKSAASQGRTTA
ncbi:MAG TPA: DNA polymerase III subunit delta' [Burkholderiaceae bacterium]|nr:DNA polymerase III subunit delta' [Burkholderiaceae bacterium]